MRISVDAELGHTYEDIPALSSDHGNPSILFPKLCFLSLLLEVHFIELPQEDVYSHFSDFISKLRQDLESRREQGHQIQRLQLKFEFDRDSESDLQSPLDTFKPIIEGLVREFLEVVGCVECRIGIKSVPPPSLDGTIFSDPGDSLKYENCGNRCLHCRLLSLA